MFSQQQIVYLVIGLAILYYIYSSSKVEKFEITPVAEPGAPPIGDNIKPKLEVKKLPDGTIASRSRKSWGFRFLKQSWAPRHVNGVPQIPQFQLPALPAFPPPPPVPQFQFPQIPQIQLPPPPVPQFLQNIGNAFKPPPPPPVPQFQFPQIPQIQLPPPPPVPQFLQNIGGQLAKPFFKTVPGYLMPTDGNNWVPDLMTNTETAESCRSWAQKK